MDFLTHHMLRSSAIRFPDTEALVQAQQRLTYADTWQRTSRLAYGLRQLGLERSERVGIFLEPSVAQAVSVFGVSQAGGAFVPIHHTLFPDQIGHIATDCGMTGLITTAAKREALADVIAANRSLRWVIEVDGDESTGSTVGDCPIYTLEAVCQESHTDDVSDVADVAIEKDLAAILYTSGSTGKPKGVMFSHANVMAGASIVSDYLNISHTDRILAALPFSFDAGLNQLTTAMQQGSTLVLIKFLFAREIVHMLEAERITGLAGVPPLWSLLSQPSSQLHQKQLQTLRYITNTGGALPQPVLASLRQALPETQVFLMYGLTEAFRSTYLPPEELDRRPSSMGKAIPNTEILVMNEQSQRCGPGEVGELVHHGPTVSMGYWGQPELTNKVLRPHPFPTDGISPGERVCYSGDLVKMDAEGFLHFIGRRDNLIKSSGFRVSPTEVEEGLCKSGQLREAAVIGLPDEMLGQRIKAFVVPSENAVIEPDQLLADCASRLPRHMVPKAVEVLEALPKTASGKVNYPALRDREALTAADEHEARV